MEPGFQITANVLESQLCTKESERIFSPLNKYANEDAAMYWNINYSIQTINSSGRVKVLIPDFAFFRKLTLVFHR